MNNNDVSQPTQRLIARYQEWYNASQSKEKSGTISVDEVASRVASFYEKMRGVIDWREEHLLRKTAVERILRRRLFIKKTLSGGKDKENIAEPFVAELIRGGHFPNESIPESKIDEVQKLINKHVYILENAPSPNKESAKLRLYDWLVGIAACEVEAVLAPPMRENALIEFMLEIMKEKVEFNGRLIIKKISAEEKDTQLYIATQKALFKLDPPIINYNILKLWYPDWSNLPPQTLSEIAKNIYSIQKRIKNEFKHPLSEKFYNVCERYDTPYLILGDIISQDPDKAKENLKNPQVLENKIREAYGRRLKTVKARMRRAAIYSTISILLTKMVVAFAIEVPFDKYINQFDYSALGLNILIPPLLMLFLVLSIRPPSKRNEGLVIMEVMKIVYTRERKDIYEIKPSPQRGFILNLFIVGFYILSFAISYGLIIWALQEINFSFISILIFLSFFSLISFAGVKIRQRAKELVVEKDKETFLYAFVDLFSLPIIQVGKWLSAQWTKYNALVVLFNSLIDMPFQIFVEFLEQWRSFLKEKKEKIH